MDIVDVLFVKGFSGFYFDDQAAVRDGANHDGFTYIGRPETDGFSSIRQAGECISVVMRLSDGRLAKGDCTAVQYSGAAGRDPLFLADGYLPLLEERIKPRLVGRKAEDFLENSRWIDGLEVDGVRLHTAIRYGVSQAFLDAAAVSRGITPTEVICDAYGLPVVPEPVRLFGESGDDRYQAVDKMIMKNVDALPHALINNVNEKLGPKGEKLVEYLHWLSVRIRTLRTDPAYVPQLQVAVFGTIGMLFHNNPEKVAAYLARLEDAAKPFSLYVESPVDTGSRAAQIETFGAIRDAEKRIGCSVRIVADDWCNTYQDTVDFVDSGCCDMIQIKTPDLGAVHNTVEAVLYCNRHGTESYLGGSCNETDVSARMSVHLGLASRPNLLMVKPGMGFDEGLMIVRNEMARTIAVLRSTGR